MQTCSKHSVLQFALIRRLLGQLRHNLQNFTHRIASKEEKEEENLFAKKAGCQKGLQPIDAG